MVKIRLKRLGRKKNPVFRIVVINSKDKRQGAPIVELGYYNPKTKEMKFNKELALEWISKGAQASETVSYLIKNCDKDGSLIYNKKEEKKLSKKAQAKLEAEKTAKENQAKTPVDETKAEETTVVAE